ncbi:hypothetical protein Tco_0086228 [Tanacetum coccineum]
MKIGAPETRHRLPVSSKDSNKTDLLHLGPGRGRRVVCSIGERRPGKLADIRRVKTVREVTGSPNQEDTCQTPTKMISLSLGHVRKETLSHLAAANDREGVQQHGSHVHLNAHEMLESGSQTPKGIYDSNRRDDQVRQIVAIHQRLKAERQAKGRNGQKRQAPSHLDDSTMGEGSKAKGHPEFLSEDTITFPVLGEEETELGQDQ